MHNLGENIQTLRDKKLLKRRQLADATGIKYSTLSNYENGVREPDIGTLLLLADFFDITLDELVKGVEGRAKQPEASAPVICPYVKALSTA